MKIWVIYSIIIPSTGGPGIGGPIVFVTLGVSYEVVSIIVVMLIVIFNITANMRDPL